MLEKWSDQLAEAWRHPADAFPLVLVAALGGLAAVVLLHLVVSLIAGKTTRPRQPWRWWDKLIYAGVCLAVGTLSVTAFYSIWARGAMTGWWLIVHMLGAGAMTGFLPLLALIWCVPNRMDGSRRDTSQETFAPKFDFLGKVLFWLLLAGGLAVMGTMLVSMLPLFGMDVLEQLLMLHRYAGLLVAVVLVAHWYLVLLQRAKLR